MTAPTTTGLIARDDAVTALADAYRERSAYLLLAPPGHALAVADMLADVPGWTAYTDAGLDAVLRARTAAVLRVTGAVESVVGPTMITMFVVPKSAVSAAVLFAAIGQPGGDESRDLITFTTDDQTMWPDLFVSALDRVDPGSAEAIRAARLPGSGALPALHQAIVDGFRARLGRGEVDACRHVAAGEVERAWWVPWAPGRMRCDGCHGRAEARVRADDAANHACDVCGQDSRPTGLHVGAVPLTGPDLPPGVPVATIVVGFGACDRCAGAGAGA